MSDEDIAIDFDEIDEGTEEDKAYLVTIDDEEYFFPKSLCRVYHKSKKIYAPEWICIKQGLV